MINRCAVAAVAMLALLAAACTEPPQPETIAIVGATLVDPANPPVAHSVVVVRKGRISAIGPQQTIPIPPGSEKVNGLGKYVAAANRGARLEPGVSADLLLLSANPMESQDNYNRVERRMVAGKWVDK